MKDYNAIVLVDEPGGNHYATWVEEKKKTIETRMKYMIPEGDIVICCGANSMTRNRLKALCVVHVAKGRSMTEDDQEKACIECVPGRVAYDLSNWRYFNRKFTFAKNKVKGSFQSIFTIRLPNDVELTLSPPRDERQ